MKVFDSFVRFFNHAKEAWADINVQLKRRYDLIPNLVNSVKGYATHESSAFENVTKARNMAMGATGPTAAHAQAAAGNRTAVRRRRARAASPPR